MTQRKGNVVVQTVNDRLRLQWTWTKALGGDGKRYWLSLGLYDDAVNQTIAQNKAAVIQRDMETGHFDPTLSKYQPDSKKNGDIDLLNLFIQFIEFKKISIGSTSLEKYSVLKKHIEQFFGLKLASETSSKDCFDFRDWLLQKQQPSTAYERLVLLSAAIDWGIAQKLVSENPCKVVVDSMQVSTQSVPHPFEAGEALKIIAAFRESPDYSFYLDLVIFQFSVGTRFGEAAALQWQHLSRDCSKITISEAVNRSKQRKSTKNHKVRYFEIPPELSAILLARRPPGYRPEGLVFPSRRSGGMISDRTFNDAWWAVVSKLDVQQLPPSKTRCTFVSLSLIDGQNPLEVCAMTGHDPKTMFEYYARFVGFPKARSLYRLRF
jgi:integrase